MFNKLVVSSRHLRLARAAPCPALGRARALPLAAPMHGPVHMPCPLVAPACSAMSTSGCASPSLTCASSLCTGCDQCTVPSCPAPSPLCRGLLSVHDVAGQARFCHRLCCVRTTSPATTDRARAPQVRHTSPFFILEYFYFF